MILTFQKEGQITKNQRKVIMPTYFGKIKWP